MKSFSKRPNSLRSQIARPHVVRSELRLTTSAIAAACVAATFSASAFAQEAQEQQDPAANLPEVSVISQSATAKTKKKKKVAKTSPAVANPQPVYQPAPEPTNNLTTDASANPYANPDAPYMVERSGSTKFTQPLVDTPRTITAVPKEVLQDKQVTTIRELARQTPGVTIGFAEGGNAFGDAIAIRGFNARNDIFVDGVRDPGNTAREAFAIEQVEIYKGPSGSVGGRGTPGGAINIITKKPNLSGSFYESETTVGTDKTVRQTFDINQVVTPDFGFRANVLYNTNEVAGRDFVEDERWGGLFSVTAKPTKDVQVTLDYYRLRTDGLPDWGVPVSRTAKVPFTELGLDRSTWYGNLSRDFTRNESDVGTSTIVAKLADNIKLTNITRFGTNTSAYVASAPRPGAGQPTASDMINITNPNRYQSTTSVSNHTDVEWKFNTGFLQHTVVAGLEYSQDTIARASYALTTTTQNIYNPNPFRTGFTVGPRSKTYDATIEDFGAYIEDTVKIGDQWIVNGGIRVDDFSRDQVGGPTQPANTAYRQDTLVNWHTGIVYKPIPIASIYAAYATAESPIGGDLDSTGVTYNGLSAATLPLKPEETTGIEVGTKWELFDRRLLATAALFQTTKDKARTNASTMVDGVAVDGNAGKYRVQGIELSVAGNITDRWSVYGGIVLMDTEVLRSNDPSEVGRRLANIPLTQFALLSSYQLTDKLRVGGQAIYNGDIVSGFFAANQFGYHTNPYWRFDAFADLKITDNLSLEINGVNLTDELYYDALYQAENSFAYVAPGRSGYLTVKWKY
ncbi:TonB-dependent siderophore receptor [Hyphomicrobium methylovorum]|uniref:TonB-dependent receptor n=1 Tax=Hyphomicrobium methylovorum TaxID=84 RepID=UPI0015E6402D|nr:TonB-dependent siderophore receptor [Hyphomicrobium methylovorum]MBA2126678.1 TonB-dependent siderophore receptor [Hyphomicrobium methylovorum]